MLERHMATETDMLERHMATETDMLERHMAADRHAGQTHDHRQTCWRDTWPQRQTCWRDTWPQRQTCWTDTWPQRQTCWRDTWPQKDTLDRHVAPGTDTDPGAASLSRASFVVTRPVAGSTRKWVLVRLYTTTLLLPAAESASVEAMMVACRTHGGAQQFTPCTFCVLPHFPSPSGSVNDVVLLG